MHTTDTYRAWPLGVFLVVLIAPMATADVTVTLWDNENGQGASFKSSLPYGASYVPADLRFLVMSDAKPANNRASSITITLSADDSGENVAVVLFDEPPGMRDAKTVSGRFVRWKALSMTASDSKSSTYNLKDYRYDNTNSWDNRASGLALVRIVTPGEAEGGLVTTAVDWVTQLMQPSEAACKGIASSYKYSSKLEFWDMDQRDLWTPTSFRVWVQFAVTDTGGYKYTVKWQYRVDTWIDTNAKSAGGKAYLESATVTGSGPNLSTITSDYKAYASQTLSSIQSYVSTALSVESAGRTCKRTLLFAHPVTTIDAGYPVGLSYGTGNGTTRDKLISFIVYQYQ